VIFTQKADKIKVGYLFEIEKGQCIFVSIIVFLDTRKACKLNGLQAFSYAILVQIPLHLPFTVFFGWSGSSCPLWKFNPHRRDNVHSGQPLPRFPVMRSSRSRLCLAVSSR